MHILKFGFSDLYWVLKFDHKRFSERIISVSFK